MEQIAHGLGLVGRFDEALSLVPDNWLARVKLQVQAGQNPSAIIAAAKSAAKEAVEDRSHAWEMTKLATAVALARQDASEAFSDALSAVEMIESRVPRDEAMHTLASALAQAGRLDQALSVGANIFDRRIRAEAVREIAVALVEAGKCDEAQDAVKQMGGPIGQALAMPSVGVALARAGRDPALVFGVALAAAAKIEDVKLQAQALRVIAGAQAEAGTFENVWEACDMVLLDQENTINEIGASMLKLTERAKAHAAMRGYLPRAALHMESAWYACGVLGQLYVNHSSDLATFLISFSRRTTS